jgi:nucleotide-binding universal stress UspA family protein
MSERILIAVDPSPASDRVLGYVARLVVGHADQYLHLMHVLPPAMPGAGESGSRAKEDAEAKERARAMLETLRSRLVELGMNTGQIDTGFLTVGVDVSTVEAIIDAARDQQCGTIVVGRNSLPWYRELFHQHPADELVKKARGFTLWIVE